LQLEFTISSKHGPATTTTATLSADGKTLTGKSKTQVSRDASGKPTFVEYSWVAEKAA
jgi:hypothetical protein